MVDVVLRNGKVESIGTGLLPPLGAHVIEAAGLYVMPGGIDPHTHLEMPFMGQARA